MLFHKHKRFQPQSSQGSFGVALVCSPTTAATSRSFPRSGEISTRRMFPRHCEFMADGQRRGEKKSNNPSVQDCLHRERASVTSKSQKVLLTHKVLSLSIGACEHRQQNQAPGRQDEADQIRSQLRRGVGNNTCSDWSTNPISSARDMALVLGLGRLKESACVLQCLCCGGSVQAGGEKFLLHKYKHTRWIQLRLD